MRSVTSAARALNTADVALMARIAGGDEQALGELYDRFGTLAYSLAIAVLRDGADAEEVVGDAFAQVWRSAGDFDPRRGSLQSWVATVTRSRALDRLRARRRTDRLATDDIDVTAEGAASLEVHAPGPDAAAESDEQRAQVEAALAALTPVQQAALRLAYFEGLSQSEIAERLNEPLGTVKTRMRAALGKLRALLAPLRERGEL